MWSSAGVTALAFITGALAFWMPTFLSRAQINQNLRPPCTKEPCDTTDRCNVTFDPRQASSYEWLQSFNNAVCSCSYIFGAVTLVTGILGGSLGTASSRWLRDRVPNADPLICAVGMLGSVPCLFITIFVASSSIPVTYVKTNFCVAFYSNFMKLMVPREFMFVEVHR